MASRTDDADPLEHLSLARLPRPLDLDPSRRAPDQIASLDLIEPLPPLRGIDLGRPDQTLIIMLAGRECEQLELEVTEPLGAGQVVDAPGPIQRTGGARSRHLVLVRVDRLDRQPGALQLLDQGRLIADRLDLDRAGVMGADEVGLVGPGDAVAGDPADEQLSLGRHPDLGEHGVVGARLLGGGEVDVGEPAALARRPLLRGAVGKPQQRLVALDAEVAEVGAREDAALVGGRGLLIERRPEVGAERSFGLREILAIEHLRPERITLGATERISLRVHAGRGQAQHLPLIAAVLHVGEQPPGEVGLVPAGQDQDHRPPWHQPGSQRRAPPVDLLLADHLRLGFLRIF